MTTSTTGVSANHVHGFGRLILQNVGRPSVECAEHLWVSLLVLMTLGSTGSRLWVIDVDRTAVTYRSSSRYTGA